MPGVELAQNGGDADGVRRKGGENRRFETPGSIAASTIPIDVGGDGHLHHHTAKFGRPTRRIGSAEILLPPRLLGLDRDALHTVVDTFCEDLLSSKQLAWADACPVDEYTLAQMMHEIDDPALRRKVLGLCVKLAEADGHIAVGESIVLDAAVEHWGLHHHMFRLPEAVLPQRSG